MGTSTNMRKRGVPEISLKASNDVGGLYFMSLYTGKTIHSYIWNELTTDDDVIRRVEELAAEENQPLLLKNNPLFEWRLGKTITNSEQINDNSTVEDKQGIL